MSATRSYRCGRCEETFDGYKKLTKHSWVEHGLTRSSICRDCGRHFRSKDELRHHLSIAHDLKNHLRAPCTKCPKVYETKTRLSIHMGREHGGNNVSFPCMYCGMRLRSVARRDRHHEIHKNGGSPTWRRRIQKFIESQAEKLKPVPDVSFVVVIEEPKAIVSEMKEIVSEMKEKVSEMDAIVSEMDSWLAS